MDKLKLRLSELMSDSVQNTLGSTIFRDAYNEIVFLEAQLDKANERIEQLTELSNAAKKYIDESPCDPDIYDDQIKAWRKYQDLLEAEAGRCETTRTPNKQTEE